MQSIRFYIVTYNQPEQLKITYDSLMDTTRRDADCDVSIINNHSHFAFDGQAKVFHNVLRPDHSYGYLARNWNQAFVLGFERTVAPATRWIGLVQSDVIFQDGWFDWFREQDEKKEIDLFQFGPGDQFVLLNLAAFKRIGWFDERFTSLALQEYDYFLRAYIHLKERCSLQGHYGKRGIYNSPAFDAIVREEEHRQGHSMEAHPQQSRWFNHKWGKDIHDALRGPGGVERWAQWTAFIDQKLARNAAEKKDENDREFPPKEINWYPFIYENDPESYDRLYV